MDESYPAATMATSIEPPATPWPPSNQFAHHKLGQLVLLSGPWDALGTEAKPTDSSPAESHLVPRITSHGVSTRLGALLTRPNPTLHIPVFPRTCITPG